MRHHRYLIGILALFLLAATPASGHDIVVRQKDEPSQPARATATPQSQASQDSSVTSAVSDRSSSTPEPSSHPSSGEAATGSTVPSLSTAVHAPATSASNAPVPSVSAASTPDPLPIHPSITPAIGLAGVLLLISGLVYTVIGIKNKWLYVFSSAAYLASLAVTVLIIYLMSPPVSNAVQGGFFVAVFISGLIFGALALVFSDITDGLGCLLGGFCLSMWFLTLKQGGLIQSTAGRAIFIGCMSFAGFALSFSHYTRTYGLIVSISFAGATVTTLGIDCLSRAGWKEFWIYLWDLNENVFPLNTNTYPITRGIRVELAAVILISVMGIVSQLRLWKLVKDRRERKTAFRLEQNNNQAREDEELGRKIEDDMARERAQWEAAFGNQQPTTADSGIGSSQSSIPKTSFSVREKRTSNPESFELVDLPHIPSGAIQLDDSGNKPSKRESGPTVTVTVLQDNEIQQIDSDGNPLQQENRRSMRYSGAHSNTDTSARASTEGNQPATGEVTRSVSAKSSLHTPPPKIIPLPFTIPKEDDLRSHDGDNTSISAVPESVHDSFPKRRSWSKRLSATSAKNRLSAGRMSVTISESRESLIVPHDDDRASSVAATFDEEDNVSLQDLSPLPSPLAEGFSPTIEVKFSSEDTVQGPMTVSGEAPQIEQAEEAGVPKPQKSLTVSTDPKGETDETQSKRPKSLKSVPPSPSSHAPSQVESLKEVLPERLSKIAMSYRTNEWAKHLSHADTPDVDELQEPESPGVMVEHGLPEPVKPVPAELVEPVLEVNRKRASSGGNPYRNSTLGRSASNMSRYSLGEAPTTLTRTPSAVTLTTPAVPPSAFATSGMGSISRPASAAKVKGLRSSSTPLLTQPLVESPMEAEMNRKLILTPPPANTLMGKRESLIRNRPSTQSFAGHTSTLNLAGPTVNSLNRAAQVDDEDIPLVEKMRSINEDNMTLAQRKQMLQTRPSSRPPSASQQWRQSSWAIGGAHMQDFDSHQPNRAAGLDQGKREQMLANWRESMRQDRAPAHVAEATQETRRAMIDDRRHKEMEKQQQERAATYRDQMVDSMMRTGEMLDAHREAMRRMQAVANKKV